MTRATGLSTLLACLQGEKKRGAGDGKKGKQRAGAGKIESGKERKVEDEQ